MEGLKVKIHDLEFETSKTCDLYKEQYKSFKIEKNDLEREKRDILTTRLQLHNT